MTEGRKPIQPVEKSHLTLTMGSLDHAFIFLTNSGFNSGSQNSFSNSWMMYLMAVAAAGVGKLGNGAGRDVCHVLLFCVIARLLGRAWNMSVHPQSDTLSIIIICT